jgi:hypothetical protein
MFSTLLHDREMIDLLVVLLTLYPLIRILKRLGLKPVFAFLAFFSIVVPLLGHMLVAIYAVSRRWPALPPLPKRVRRTA